MPFHTFECVTLFWTRVMLDLTRARFFRGSLLEDRVGDICNACVLLVKRWKKLPHGSKKNWNHVSLFLIIIFWFIFIFWSYHNFANVMFFVFSLYDVVLLWTDCVHFSLLDSTQVVDARAGPGFKMTKPKKIKNGDGKKKSKLKKLHKLRRQSRS